MTKARPADTYRAARRNEQLHGAHGLRKTAWRPLVESGTRRRVGLPQIGPSRYMPHQGLQECVRRAGELSPRQVAAIQKRTRAARL